MTGIILLLTVVLHMYLCMYVSYNAYILVHTYIHYIV